jgi:hypothetical protein
LGSATHLQREARREIKGTSNVVNKNATAGTRNRFALPHDGFTADALGVYALAHQKEISATGCLLSSRRDFDVAP